MNRSKNSPKRPGMLYRIVRAMARLVFLLLLLLAAVFAYVSTIGVPQPLLQEVLEKANGAGIPIGIRRIRYTLEGWIGDDVRYYSLVPGDTKPVFRARTVRFSRNPSENQEPFTRWAYDIEADGVEISPSVEWGLEIPERSRARKIEQIRLSLSFLPDRIVFADGEMEWWGVAFSVNGTIVKATPETVASREPKAPKKQKTVFPVYVTRDAFQTFEDGINAIQIHGPDTLDADFFIDANDYTSNRLEVRWVTDDFSARGVHFSRMELNADYLYPSLDIERLGLYQEEGALELSGAYELSTQMLQGTLSNTIASTTVLELLPAKIHDVLKHLDMQFGQLPLFDLAVGPCQVADAFNDLAGNYSIREFTIGGASIEVLEGSLKRENDRLTFHDITGTLLGQEERAKETGSGMLGGTASASVYFDSGSHWFGVDADVEFDPTLLIGPLSSVRIATNVMHRLQFNGQQAPIGHLSLGSCVTNWSTFFIDIAMTGNDVTLHDATFSEIDVATAYTNGVLRIEPLSARQGTNTLTGTISLNFTKNTAEMDVFTSMPLLTLQDAAYPPLGVFGDFIKTPGRTVTSAKGTIDWKGMKATDFVVDIEAERLDLPVAELTEFSGTVLGDGPLLTITNAQFSLFEGSGVGTLTLEADPESAALPYGVDLVLEQVNCGKLLHFFDSENPPGVSGMLAGSIGLQGDLKQDFGASANGAMSLAITKGHLMDLPVFKGFSKVMRKIFPSYHTFSIHGYTGSLEITNGVIHTEDSYFDGDLVSAKVHGDYSRNDGFDAIVQVQTLSDGLLSRVVRVATDPILKVFEIKLTGPLSDPSWKFDKF